ncbi:hypothetical protein L0128_06190, partial [candidate division KSB1 bacterium]|nr:hypothetical protein [candidate division KSB1 bacterium]
LFFKRCLLARHRMPDWVPEKVNIMKSYEKIKYLIQNPGTFLAMVESESPDFVQSKLTSG